jgi:Tfp pilus assembly protein PilX
MRRQGGVALPVMLIMMLVMLVTSIYLLRSSNSATLAASNLAYDATLSRAVDFGLHTGFQWLSDTAAADKASLNAHDAANGYSAIMDTTWTPNDEKFWESSIVVQDPDGNRIRYAIHRMCSNPGGFSSATQRCLLTSANTVKIGNRMAIGESLASDAPAYASSPQIHYVITARIDGARGGNVINQMAVLIGA